MNQIVIIATIAIVAAAHFPLNGDFKYSSFLEVRDSFVQTKA